jgi:hypothetical protein
MEMQEQQGLEAIADDAEIIKAIATIYDDCKTTLDPLYRAWLKGYYFYFGDQWLEYDPGLGFQRVRSKKKFIKLPVTNKVATAADNFTAILSRAETNFNFVPSNSLDRSVATSAFLNKLEKYILEVNNIRQMRQTRASWLGMTGNCGMLSGISNGELYTELLSFFQVRCNMMIPTLQEQEEVVLVGFRSKNYIEAMYPDTMFEDKDLMGNAHGDTGMNTLQTISKMVPSFGMSSMGIGRFGIGANNAKGVIEKRYFKKKSNKYPEGLYAVEIAGKIVEKKKLPVWPLVSAKFNEISGSLIGTTPLLLSLIQKQEQLNEIDLSVQIWAKRLRGHTWLLEKGLELSGSFSDEFGEVMRWGNIGNGLPNSTGPSRLPLQEIPASLITYRRELNEDFEHLSSLASALRGEEPYSGAPASAIRTLIEQGNQYFGPAFRSIAEADRQWMKVQIALMKTYPTNDKENVYVSMSEDSRWTTESFEQLDSFSAIDVRVESDAHVPANSEAESAKILELLKNGFFDLANVETRIEVSKVLGVAHIQKGFIDAAESVAREHEALMGLDDAVVEAYVAAVDESKASMGTVPMPPPLLEVDPILDDHGLSEILHRKFANTDAGKKYAKVLSIHVASHMEYLDALASPTQTPTPKKVI